MDAIGAKVLVVDHDEEILTTLESLLEDDGFDTTTAWTGLDALKAINGKGFDLVLVSDYLPDMDAEKLIQQLHRAAGDVPCVVMQTSREPIPGVRSLIWTGAVDVVCKWSSESVLETVRRYHLRRSIGVAGGRAH